MTTPASTSPIMSSGAMIFLRMGSTLGLGS
jgi:hypothetical protein